MQPPPERDDVPETDDSARPEAAERPGHEPPASTTSVRKPTVARTAAQRSAAAQKAAATRRANAAKKAASGGKPIQRRTAPKPASRAASLVASSTLSGRPSVTDDVLRKWETPAEGAEVREGTEEPAVPTSAVDEAAPSDVRVDGSDTVQNDDTDAVEDADSVVEDADTVVDQSDTVVGDTVIESDLVEEIDTVDGSDLVDQSDTVVETEPGVEETVPDAGDTSVVESTADADAELEPHPTSDPTDDPDESSLESASEVEPELPEPDASSAAEVEPSADVAVQPYAVAVAAPSSPTAPVQASASRDVVLAVDGLSKSFDGTVAVHDVNLTVHTGSIFGIVGPNGAGKTTTLSMVTGLLRPDSGRVLVHDADVWKDPTVAKRNMGVLPDRLRLFDRLTGAQLLHYSGSLRGLDRATVKTRSADLAVAFGLEDALSRLVTDYSAGMTKKIALAAAMIHSPLVLILDEPFEAVDPVSAANVIEILQKYAAAGGTVVMSSHSMDMIQRICDSVSIIVHGEVLASGTMDEVRAGGTLEERFVDLAGGRKAAEGMEWLHSFSV